jgi:hypothetical protein
MDSFPERGLVFWPVGYGDSTTIVVDSETIVQIDIHHLEKSEDDSDPCVPIIDELIEHLPIGEDGKPYLAVFGATHLDADHITGFAEFRDRVTIGDLWFTPRVLWDQDKDGLCEDAQAFRDEAKRRIEKMKAKREVGSGDRIRIIGYGDVLKKHSEIYENLPEGSVTIPGTAFTALDGVDRPDAIRVFVHAPFKEDAEGERNETSFALQVTLRDGDSTLQAMLLGDLAYEGVKKIFERSEDEDLAWDVFLAPHQCSKSVMYAADEGEPEPTLKRALLDAIEAAGSEDRYIIASCTPIPDVDENGANPPHRIAADRYKERVPSGHFLCTGEHPNEDAPEPIVFELTAEGSSLNAAAGVTQKRFSRLSEGIAASEGVTQAPAAPVGFGRP